jgi:hypothetical protein
VPGPKCPVVQEYALAGAMINTAALNRIGLLDFNTMHRRAPLSEAATMTDLHVLFNTGIRGRLRFEKWKLAHIGEDCG